MALILVTPPASEPLTLDEVKLHLRVDFPDDDDLIGSLITSARLSLDGRDGLLGRALITQTLELSLDRFPRHFHNRNWNARIDSHRAFPPNVIAIPAPPLVSITSVKYDDAAGAEQTLSTGDYYLDAASDPARIAPVSGCWPETPTGNWLNAVRIRFVAGYGDASDVPMPIKHAMKLIIGHWYEQRSTAAPKTLAEIPLGAESLLARYRIWSF